MAAPTWIKADASVIDFAVRASQPESRFVFLDHAVKCDRQDLAGITYGRTEAKAAAGSRRQSLAAGAVG
jgi:hypothetical protein